MKKLFGILCILCLMLSGCAKKSVEKPIVPSPTPMTEYRTLKISENPSLYAYADMEKDLETLSLAYKDFTQLAVIGKTPDGRNIYDFIIGSANADTHAVIHGSIHAREYITTKLVMKQLAYYLENLSKNTGSYKGISYSDLFNNIALHIVPMVNPDGVTLCQYGLNGLNTDTAKQNVKNITLLDGYTDFSQWKANVNGVDLNRNYDALWNEYIGPSHPSSDRYKGTSPGSESETKALMSITEKYPVKRTISYHTYGQVIYWYFARTGTLLNDTKSFAKEISDITGYPTDANYSQLDPAGYKDWAISKLNIPSLTIEVGYGKNPVPDTQFDGIWSENKDVWAGMLYDLKF